MNYTATIGIFCMNVDRYRDTHPGGRYYFLFGFLNTVFSSRRVEVLTVGIFVAHKTEMDHFFSTVTGYLILALRLFNTDWRTTH